MVTDLLVDAGIVEDDNYKIVLHFAGFRPEQGADVYIYYE